MDIQHEVQHILTSIDNFEGGYISPNELRRQIAAIIGAKKPNQYYTGEATVKGRNQPWRYDGMRLKILGVKMTYYGVEPVFPDGTREFKLSLEGTKWHEYEEYTCIPETDLIIHSLTEY